MYSPLLDGVLDDEPLDEDFLLLAEPVDAVVRLRLRCVVPRKVHAAQPSIHQHEGPATSSVEHSLDDPVGGHEVQADAAALRARRAASICEWSGGEVREHDPGHT